MHGKLVQLRNDFLIIDPDDQLAIVKKIIKDDVREHHFFADKPKAIVNFINKCKDEGKRSCDLTRTDEHRFQRLIYSKYETRLRQENKLDFAELILLTKGS
jgi:DNA helicase II / ATP-dependent DNA helicase PcrA